MSDQGNPNYSRRNALKLTGGIVASGMLAGCGGDGDGGDGTPTPDQSTPDQSTPTATEAPSYEGTIGQIGFELVSIPNTVAAREMLPESTNDRFTATIQNMSGGTVQMPALLGGETQFALTSPGTAYQAAVAGADLKMVGTAVAGTDYVIGASEDVTSLSAFVEQDLSMAANVGTLSGNQVEGVFAQEELDSGEVNFINVGGSSDRTQALASGNADGAAIHIGQLRGLQEEGLEVHALAEVAEYYPTFIQNTICTTAEFIGDDVGDAYTQAYMNQLYQANQRATEDFQWIYDATQRYTAEPLPEDSARDTWELNNEYGAWQTEPLTREGYEGVLQMLSAAGQIEADAVDLDSLLEPSYSETAVEQLE